MFSSKKIINLSRYFIESNEGGNPLVRLDIVPSVDSNYISVYEESRNRWWLDLPVLTNQSDQCHPSPSNYKDDFIIEWNLVDGSNYIINSGFVFFEMHGPIEIKSPTSQLTNNRIYRFKHRQARVCYSPWSQWVETKSLLYKIN